MAQSAIRSMVMNFVSRETDGDHSMHDDHSGMDHSSHDTHGGMDMSDHLMSPYLFGNMKEFFLLFREARISTGGGLAIGIVASLLFSAFSTIVSMYAKTVERKSEIENKRVSLAVFFASIMFGLRMFLHYISMLLTMSMNIWIILAVVVGHLLGYLVYSIATYGTKISNRDGCDVC